MTQLLSLAQFKQITRDDRYLVVVGAFIVMTLAWGIYYSFGIFLIPLLEEFGWTRANTAGAFAVAIFIEGLGGIYAGRIADRLGIRRVVIGCGIDKWFPAGVYPPTSPDSVLQVQNSIDNHAASLPEGPLLPAGTGQQLVLICSILLFWGYAAYGVMAHFAAYAIALDIIPPQAAFALAFMGAMISFGKITIGISVDRFGSKPTLVAALAMMFVSLLWLKQASLLWEFYLFAVIFSFGFACASVVMPGLVADTFGLRSHGYLLGITNVFACIGCAIGPVLAGHLYDATGNYNSAIWIFAASGLASTVIASCLRSSHQD